MKYSFNSACIDYILQFEFEKPWKKQPAASVITILWNIGIHHEYIHVGQGYLTQGIRNFSPVWRGSAESPGVNVCPEGEISISYMNKRVDGFIFSHLKTIYLSDSFAYVRQSYLTLAKSLSYLGRNGRKRVKHQV